MSDILCIYYSRTGNTRKAMEELGSQLDAEVVAITDSMERSGWKGFLRCGLDAMRQSVEPIAEVQTQKPLGNYRLVILGTPIWAGRCSSIMRSFLKENGYLLSNVSYVLLRGGNNKYEEVYEQMDSYLPQPHQTAVSLRADSVGYCFWQDEFLRQTRTFLESGEA